MSQTGKFLTAIIIETLAVVAIFYALGVSRDITAREKVDVSAEHSRN